ncbi:MAG: MBL fold metallo-hydrolase [Chromatiales bacterium]|nr:MBL fold metallo-hydrolase [Chromatiales bacterium]
MKFEYPCGDPPPAGETKEIAPGVLWVRMPLPFALKWINLWLLDDGDGWMVVDTGVATDESRAHWTTIFASPALQGRPVTRVLCTHMHPDHVGLAGWITDRFHCALWMSRLEYVVCRMLVADTGREAPEDGVNFYRAAGWDEAALATYRKRFGQYGRMVQAMPDSFRRVTAGESLRIGGRDWRVLGGHGHSPEHICLWSPELNLFISGDQILPRISSNVSVFPTEPDADPLSDWLESCVRLQREIPPDVLVLPAHNEPFVGAHGRLQELIDGHELCLKRVEQRLQSGPQRVVDLFGALFPGAVTSELLGFATGESLAHLNCLIARRRARRRLTTDGIWLFETV